MAVFWQMAESCFVPKWNKMILAASLDGFVQRQSLGRHSGRLAKSFCAMITQNDFEFSDGEITINRLCMTAFLQIGGSAL
jgi:hypothetical protein